ncbi:cysteine--tRNA ligase [Pseudotabrizicola alkalilacus]|uniref:Cysteine--tRNA ligase n=1 Tax=Pseudotabrizicola alkalilacus TaxID=2305252 RepID=A0A411YYV9_9RHOB|nr:cysteine--tRNA ligase [Pseudotabrizicola alkalilacus]RGP36012.1 cysteine--tRNA ligase [Pseudotabrizicola alkalilacus]
MVTIRLTNSKTHRKEDFVPLDAGNVRMYVCGPTVYDRAHLGNARPVLVFDVLFRLLREVYGADHVTYVRNFTDVDDKINAEALRRQQAGASGTLEALIRERTEETIAWYHADMDALGALRPTHEPRATEYIGEMITMIAGLVAKGHAYEREGHVLFRVRSYGAYGALSGRSVDDMIAGARVEVAPFKEDPMDFVLWKPSDAGVPGWDSPWGFGRPGWHIECSAMADKLLWQDVKSGLSPDALAQPHTFDIHGGGLDLQFPHHENEIAQSCCAHGGAAGQGDGFARVWLHNEMLQVEGKKMSKSLGNFFTVRDLLEQGYPGEVIRFVMLSTHYRKPMDWTAEKAREAFNHLRRWKRLKQQRLSDQQRPFTGAGADSDVVAAVADDLNTPMALSRLHKMVVDVQSQDKGSIDSPLTIAFFESLAFLGFDELDPDKAGRRKAAEKSYDLVSHLVDRENTLFVAYNEARNTKNFTIVDKMKAELIAAGVEVRMSKEGVELVPGPDFDPAKLEALK